MLDKNIHTCIYRLWKGGWDLNKIGPILKHHFGTLIPKSDIYFLYRRFNYEALKKILDAIENCPETRAMPKLSILRRLLRVR